MACEFLDNKFWHCRTKVKVTYTKNIIKPCMGFHLCVYILRMSMKYVKLENLHQQQQMLHNAFCSGGEICCLCRPSHEKWKRPLFIWFNSVILRFLLSMTQHKKKHQIIPSSTKYYIVFVISYHEQNIRNNFVVLNALLWFNCLLNW